MILPLLMLANVVVHAPHGHSPTPPAAAQEAGFSTLVLDDEFLGASQQVLDRWELGLWYQSGVVSPTFLARAGILSVESKAAPAWRNTFLTSGPSFGLGYFEARMRWPQSSGNWANFWLISTDPSQVPYSGAWPAYCEIDVVEAVLPGLQHAVHDWGGKNIESAASKRNYARVAVDSSQWHTYGVLRNSDRITFYVDGSPTWSSAAPKTCVTQYMSIVFGAARHDDSAQTAEFDWIRVWQ